MAGVAGVLILHLLLLMKLKFTAWPEMLLWPYLMLKGLLPYKDIAIAHTPLMLIDLSVFYKLLGVGVIELKIFTWILVLLFDILVYFVVKKLWNKKTALAALIVFALMQLFFDGNGLWFDIYMGFLAFIAYFFTQKKKYFWVGVFWGMAFISKQTAVYFLVPVGFSLFAGKKLDLKNFRRIVAGGVLVIFLFILGLAVFNILPDFYTWAINFGIFILPKASGQVQLPDIKNLLVVTFPFAVFIPLYLKNKKKSLNLFIWAIAGALGAYPRFEFFHFQPALPYIAIAFALVYKKVNKKILAVYLVAAFYLFFVFFVRNWQEGTRFYDQSVKDVVSYVSTNTNSGDKIFVMNWWDNIYALSGTLPATDPWVPQLSWYQNWNDIQDREVKDLKKNNPKFVILAPYTETGLASFVPDKIYSYIKENYQFKEKVDGVEILVPKSK